MTSDICDKKKSHNLITFGNGCNHLIANAGTPPATKVQMSQRNTPLFYFPGLVPLLYPSMRLRCSSIPVALLKSFNWVYWVEELMNIDWIRYLG